MAISLANFFWAEPQKNTIQLYQGVIQQKKLRTQSDLIKKSDTLWLCNIAMENGPFIDGLPIKNGDFPWLC
jgi:hypothetical protein